MKKLLALLLCCVISLASVACSGGDSNPVETIQTETAQEVVQTLNPDVQARMEDMLSDFEGIVYVTKNGSTVYSQATGTDENGNNLTIESPMYIGSISKQFCAASVMLLKEQGKLSLDDTLDKYFPEYKLGKQVKIKNLLSMRSGISEMVEQVSGHSADKTEDENIEIIKSWIFEQEFENYDPDTCLEYSNSNYFLLGLIVENVSGKHYNDFLRENIFNPLGMNNTGFINEVTDNSFFSNGLTYNTFTAGEDAAGMCKGAGDMISTAADMDKWMTALTSGKVVSEESFKEMTTNYSPDSGSHYGYGLTGLSENSFGHTGGIGDYVSVNYFNRENGYNIFAATTKSQTKVPDIPIEIMDILLNR